jgi:hypothetical protein
MKPETLTRIKDESPAGDLQWLSGGVDRELRDDERNAALPLMREKIAFWAEAWPELLSYIRDLETQTAALRTQLEQAQNRLEADAAHFEQCAKVSNRMMQAEARETALNAEIAALREHQKLDDELCRMCALASTIKTGAERETAQRDAQAGLRTFMGIIEGVMAGGIRLPMGNDDAGKVYELYALGQHAELTWGDLRRALSVEGRP